MAGEVSAQAIQVSLSGSGSGDAALSGTGTGTITPGGAVTATLAGAASNDNCTSLVQFSVKVQTAAPADSFTFFLTATIPPDVGGATTSFSSTTTLAITGGTGVYAGTGGAGSGTLSVTLTGKASFTYTFSGTITPGGPLVPFATVTASGVVPVFSNASIIQPTSWISIYGSNFSSGTSLWNGDFPTSLGNVTVSIDGKLGYLWLVSPTQINLQVPDDTKTGCVPVVVNTPNGSVTTSVDMSFASPSFSLLDNTYVAGTISVKDGSGAYGGGTYDIVGPAGRFPYKTRPVKRGEVITLYGVGFGPTNPTVLAGKPFSGASPTTNQIQLALISSQGNPMGVPVLFAGLISAGLYQINATIPLNAPTGDVSIQAFIGQPGPNQNAPGTSQKVTVLLSIQ
jgi:uncharacterized protein (TIGR03437 family)